jgi:hypothetical protein
MLTKLTSASPVVSVAEAAEHLRIILPSATSTQELNTTAVDGAGKIIYIIPDTSAAIQHSDDNTTWAAWQTLTSAGYYTGGKRYIKTASSGCYVALISLASNESTRLTGLIESATEIAEAELGRKLGSQQWTETLDDWPPTPYKLTLPDLVTLDSIKYYDEDNEEHTVSSSIYFVAAGTYPRLILNSGETWPSETLREIEAVKITMTCGATPTKVVKLGIKEIVKSLYYEAEDPVKTAKRIFWSSGKVVPKV